MDLTQLVSDRISALNVGESITISVQELLISRTDFQSIALFLLKESKNGMFSISSSQQSSGFERTSLTINKN